MFAVLGCLLSLMSVFGNAINLDQLQNRLLDVAYDDRVLRNLRFEPFSLTTLPNAAEAIFVLVASIIEPVWVRRVEQIQTSTLLFSDPRYPRIELTAISYRDLLTSQLGWTAMYMWDHAIRRTSPSSRFGLRMDNIKVIRASIPNRKLGAITIVEHPSVAANSTPAPFTMPQQSFPTAQDDGRFWIDFESFDTRFSQTIYLDHYYHFLLRVVLRSLHNKPVARSFRGGQVLELTISDTVMRLTVIYLQQNGETVTYFDWCVALRLMLVTPPVHDDPKAFKASAYILTHRGQRDPRGPFLQIELNTARNLPPVKGNVTPIESDGDEFALPGVSKDTVNIITY